jgi:superoxide dismutase, Fe-Mn family
METFNIKEFAFGDLNGLSTKQMEEHLKLYAGYVKHANLIQERIKDLYKDPEKNVYDIAEFRRRYSFEFNGMRMHEYYFESFVGGANKANPDSAISKKITSHYGSLDDWESDFRRTGSTRGIGWAILYYDDKSDSLVNAWVSDHELGTLAGLRIVIAMDMWEHAFMVDYLPSEKAKYIDAFLSNFNWSIAEQRFDEKT